MTRTAPTEGSAQVGGARAAETRHLIVGMYHYIRPTSATLPLRGMSPGAFAAHVRRLSTQFEFATLESALAYARGDYEPRRDLCLLTFDDGLREHWDIVVPVLTDAHVQGVFLLATATLEGTVLAVHKNHLLLAALGTREYRDRMVVLCRDLAPQIDTEPNPASAAATYRWDDSATASLKYLVNFTLPVSVSRRAVDMLFAEIFGSEAAIAAAMYFTWAEAREMQRAGMVLGGHSHEHLPLARLPAATQAADIAHCAHLLLQQLSPQPLWPFSYPFGRRDSFDATSDASVRACFSCAFTTERGPNVAPADLYGLRRMDPKEIVTDR